MARKKWRPGDSVPKHFHRFSKEVYRLRNHKHHGKMGDLVDYQCTQPGCPEVKTKFEAYK